MIKHTSVQDDRKIHIGAFVLAAGILALSLFLRIAAYPVVTDDYTYFLSVWFETLAVHSGLSAFTSVFANYAPFYLYLLKLLTLLPVPSLVSIKTLSLVFDVLVAWGVYKIVKKFSPVPYTKDGLFLVFAIAVSIPTFILNSSLWGQSDSIYAAGVVAALYFILKNKPFLGTLGFCFAFIMKLQSVFFLPILAGYLLMKKKTAWYFLIIPFVFFISIIPAWVGGGSFADLMFVYVSQTGDYKWLTLGAPTLYALIEGNSEIPPETNSLISYIGVSVAALVALGIVYMARKYFLRSSASVIILFSTFTVTLLPYLLPRMHERYFFLADILAVLYAFFNPKQWYIPALVVSASFLSYMMYVSNAAPVFSVFAVDLRIPSVLMCIAIIAMGLTLYRLFQKQKNELAPIDTTQPHRA